MAFPQVEGSNTSYESSAIDTHTVNLPSSPQSGELLLVYCAFDGADAPFASFPGGWNEIKDVAGGSSSFAAAYRISDGGEGSTITVTTTTTRQSAHASYRVSAHDSSSNAPEISAGGTGSDAAPDPDNLTPTGGSDDYLWFALCSMDGHATTGPWNITAAPTNYGNLVSRTSGGATFGCTLGVARRELSDSSENPGTFTASGSDDWIALTLAVYPVAVVTLEISVTADDSGYYKTGPVIL